MSGWSPVSRYTCALFDIREVYTLSEEVIHVFFKCVHVRDTQHSAHTDGVPRYRHKSFGAPRRWLSPLWRACRKKQHY